MNNIVNGSRKISSARKLFFIPRRLPNASDGHWSVPTSNVSLLLRDNWATAFSKWYFCVYTAVFLRLYCTAVDSAHNGVQSKCLLWDLQSARPRP